MRAWQVGSSRSDETSAAAVRDMRKTVRRDRRRMGVTVVVEMRKRKKTLKILLTGKARSNDTPAAPVTAFPPKNVPTFFSYPHAGQSQRGAPVSAQIEKEAVNSLEMDREVIRCKTCGLVQYRTRTGNCRRCVRVL